jgi:phosphate transport system substrate-binding protein
VSSRAGTLAALAAVAALATLPATASALVLGAGSTLAAPAYSKWCRESGLCSYAALGSSAGLAAIGSSKVDFAGSDAVPTDEQLAGIERASGGARPRYFPTLLAAVAIPTNIRGVAGPLRLSGDALGRIFAGAITRWSDPALRRLNPRAALPAAPITVCVREDGSGTSFGFSRYLTKVSPLFRARVGEGQLPAWRAPRIVRATGNPGVAQCVADHEGAIGYADLPDVIEVGLAPKAAAIGQPRLVRRRTAAGLETRRATRWVRPSLASLQAAGRAARIPADLLLDTTASRTPGAYPITLTTWIVAYGDYAAAGRDGAAVRAVLDYFYGAQAQGQLTGMGYAPPPPELVAAARAQLAELR